MPPSPSTGNGTARTRTSAIVALVSFVAYLAVPGGLRLVALALMLVAAVGVVACSVVAARERGSRTTVLRVAAASAVGMVSSVLYLNSMGGAPTAIVGVLLLLVSINGLFFSSLLLRRTRLGRGVSR